VAANMKSVLIFGAGSIGNHLAHACRNKDWEVAIYDADPQALERTRETIYPQRYGKWDNNICLVHGKEDCWRKESDNEGMSNALLEAMACGLPVIATDTGGGRELIKGNGFIVKKGDILDLQKTINYFIENPELVISMGKISRILAETMNWKRIARAYYEVYMRRV